MRKPDRLQTANCVIFNFISVQSVLTSEYYFDFYLLKCCCTSIAHFLCVCVFLSVCI